MAFKHSGVLTLENINLDAVVELPLPDQIKNPIIKELTAEMAKESAAKGVESRDWMKTIWKLEF
jgi:hypothetical protein